MSKYVYTYTFVYTGLVEDPSSFLRSADSEQTFICRGKNPSSVHCMDLVVTVPYQLCALLTSTGISGEGTAGRDTKVSMEIFIPFAEK